jgi:pullulanase
MAIYELHVRDFSIADETVPSAERGTFAAFTETTSNGMKHLQALADAGMTHLHLLPVFDCATINENKSEQKTILDNLATYAPDSEAQQAAVDAIRGQDGFNWCYDPHHYTVPDGSYATTPDGTARIREFRSMVSALNNMGLRVVMDVVYNHTSGSLLGDKSVLDKVVPSYYHRLNAKGDIETSTCCANTASENNMMEKLMADSIKTWATAYKVDGFRYDIMGHHTKDNILNIKNAVQALTPASDGVDGSKIYFYGEGWNFGEVQNNARFTQATLGNMSGTGVGTFNNFIRDAVRGGGPFDSGIDHVRTQSFINGLYLDPNAENMANADSKAELLKQSDVLRVVLAGSLADYSLVDRTGATIKASAIEGAGYTQDPQETINYIEAHDNETLFDMIQYKAPLATSMAERVRMQNLGNSIVVLAQGIPFIHAGQDMLRSKSTDRNSYDAGDWFNAIDYTYQHNGWGKGLPLKADNEQNWAITKPLLANTALMPTADDIARTREHMTELLKIRRSSKLFRLETAAQIQQQVAFYNTGATQKAGVIAMGLKDSDANLDPNAEAIVVIYNANTTSQTLAIADYKGWDFALHAVQQASSDSRVKTSTMDKTKGEFTVPARTMAVFVATQKPAVGGGTVEPIPSEPAPSKPKKGGGSSSILLLLMLAGLCVVPMVKRQR